MRGMKNRLKPDSSCDHCTCWAQGQVAAALQQQLLAATFRAAFTPQQAGSSHSSRWN